MIYRDLRNAHGVNVAANPLEECVVVFQAQPRGVLLAAGFVVSTLQVAWATAVEDWY